MGGGGETSGSSSSSSALSSLAAAQQTILEQREKDYENIYQPYLNGALKNAFGSNTLATNYMKTQADGINQQYNQSKTSFSQSMAQRGLSGSGAEAQGLSSLESTKGQTLANASAAAQQYQTQQQNSLLGMALGASPTPTQAAPVLSSGSSSNSGWNFNVV